MREFPNAVPRPWVAQKQFVGTANHMSFVAECRGKDGFLHADERSKDNAALIVHAVNTMEERERLLEEAAEVLNFCLGFIAAQYLDERLAPSGEWLAPEARPVHEKLCAFLAKLEARDA